jgi:hypothetical protein
MFLEHDVLFVARVLNQLADRKEAGFPIVGSVSNV